MTLVMTLLMKRSCKSINSSSEQKASSGSSIQNSSKWRRVRDFSARKVGPKQ